MFWGVIAQKLISDEIRFTTDGPLRNLILVTDHPVAGIWKKKSDEEDKFLNCHHFSKANEFLREVGRDEINWTIPNLLDQLQQR